MDETETIEIQDIKSLISKYIDNEDVQNKIFYLITKKIENKKINKYQIVNMDEKIIYDAIKEIYSNQLLSEEDKKIKNFSYNSDGVFDIENKKTFNSDLLSMNLFTKVSQIEKMLIEQGVLNGSNFN